MTGYIFVIKGPSNPHFNSYRFDYNDYYIDGYVTSDGRTSWSRAKKDSFPAPTSVFSKGRWSKWVG